MKDHISMRRKYDLRGKDRLCHYQAKFDSCMEEIRNLEIAHFFAATLSAVLVSHCTGSKRSIGAVMRWLIDKIRKE